VGAVGAIPLPPPLFPCIHTESGGHAQTREFTGLRGNSQNTGGGVVEACKSGGIVGAAKESGCMENLNVARLKPLK